MAKEAKHESESADAAPPKKSKKLLIIVLAAVLLLVLVGGGAAFFLMKNNAAEGEDGEVATEKAEKKKSAKEVDPVYVALDAFVVNLGAENGGPFLQLTISVEVEDLHMGDKLKKSTPKMRNDVIMLLSGKKSEELITKEGKATLANEVRDLMNGILEPGSKGDDGPVKEVLFTSFIIQ